MINSYTEVSANWPEDVEIARDTPLFAMVRREESARRCRLELERDGGWAYDCLADVIALFGRPLNEVEGLCLDASYTTAEDGWFEATLSVRDGKCTYKESTIAMEELPMERCLFDIGPVDRSQRYRPLPEIV